MRKVFKALGVIVLVLIILLIAVAAYLKLALPDVGPAPELKVQVTPQRIERGRYLANHVMICMDCHSTRNWNEFSGPLQEGSLGKGGELFDKGAGFPGTYYSANITPAGLKDWTDGEIFRAITTGVRKNGKAIFPVMPYRNYGQLDAEDIHSVIAYLRTLPAIENRVPESASDFPMNFIINTFPKKIAPSKFPSDSNSIEYGKYMVTAASCGECHTPFEKGKFVEELRFAGGRSFSLPSGVLVSTNITPDNETGIGSWTREMFIARFKAYRDTAFAHRKVDFLKEYNSIMPWTMYAGMTDHDLGAIYTFLRTLKPMKHSVVRFKNHTKK